MDFCLIFVPFGHYDEPEILRYAKTRICPKGADVRQVGDVVTSYNGREVSTVMDFLSVNATLKQGDAAPMALVRNGTPMELAVQF